MYAAASCTFYSLYVFTILFIRSCWIGTSSTSTITQAVEHRTLLTAAALTYVCLTSCPMRQSLLTECVCVQTRVSPQMPLERMRKAASVVTPTSASTQLQALVVLKVCIALNHSVPTLLSVSTMGYGLLCNFPLYIHTGSHSFSGCVYYFCNGWH